MALLRVQSFDCTLLGIGWYPSVLIQAANQIPNATISAMTSQRSQTADFLKRWPYGSNAITQAIAKISTTMPIVVLLAFWNSKAVQKTAHEQHIKIAIMSLKWNCTKTLSVSSLTQYWFRIATKPATPNVYTPYFVLLHTQL